MKSPRKGLLLTLLFSISALYAPPTRIVFTGGQCIGKTTLIEYLKEQGYQVCPENFLLVRAEYEHDGRLQEFLDIVEHDVVQLQTILLNYQDKLEAALIPGILTFFDRGGLDGPAFIEHRGVAVPEDFKKRSYAHSYDLVFALDPLPADLFDQAGFRRESPEDAKAIHERLKATYTQNGYRVIDVPFDTVENRAAFVLAAIKKRSE